MKLRLRAVAVLLALLIGLVLLSFAMPVKVWRTGERPAAPLQLVENGPAVEMPKRIWIDTDAACGESETTDPDDCFAVLLLARAPGGEIAGVSTVQGNADSETTDRITRELVALLRREVPHIGPVHRGAAALGEALDKGPLTLVALGPLTNVAAALAARPDRRKNIARLIAVMGRRPGHLFHPSEGAGGGMLFGHGPVFRDFNFEQDREAAAQVLAMQLSITLVPYVAARQVSLTRADLAALEAQGGAAAWVASRARGWLSFWQEAVGRDGFYPFDLLAAIYAVQPQLLSCGTAGAWVGRDDQLWDWIWGPEALLVGPQARRTSDVKAAGPVLYCPKVDARMHDALMSRLAGG